MPCHWENFHPEIGFADSSMVDSDSTVLREDSPLTKPPSPEVTLCRIDR